jgi:GntR family transcriptional regulator
MTPLLCSIDDAPPVDAISTGLTEANSNRRTPLYLRLARALEDAIRSGAFPVGSLLPTELDLSQRHGVSRQTVRQAIGELRRKGLLSARKGVGTRVDAHQPPKRFTYAAVSASDLVEIAEGTEVTVDSREWIVARGAVATGLGCRAHHRWLRLDCTRWIDGETRPLASVTVHIDGRLAPLINIPDRFRTALFNVLERHSGETIMEIQQEIRATIIDEALGDRLSCEAGTSALEITRRYFGSGRRLILVSVNILPSDRFFYSVAISPNDSPRAAG